MAAITLPMTVAATRYDLPTREALTCSGTGPPSSFLTQIAAAWIQAERQQLLSLLAKVAPAEG